MEMERISNAGAKREERMIELHCGKIIKGFVL